LIYNTAINVELFGLVAGFPKELYSFMRSFSFENDLSCDRSKR